jgi:mannobiose 2-epimerase
MRKILEETKKYLKERLIPFWAKRVAEPEFGGFQTNYDRKGNRTDVTEKTLLCQGRCIFTLSHAVRLGFDWPGSFNTISQGLNFLFEHFKDKEHDGYYWIVEEDGRVIDDNKVLYGHSFLVYGLSEYALLTGDKRAEEEAVGIFELIQKKSIDPVYGGYYEHFDRHFNLSTARDDTGGHKSLDVHMHLMEAFTNLFELTGSALHKAALENVIDLIFDKMVDSETGVGISMFRSDWQPIANVELKTVWGSDRFDHKEKAFDLTSYGHNIELAWLYLHSLDVLGIPLKRGMARVEPIFRHTFERGVDWKYGGLFVEGRRKGDVTEDNKEFWQQAEAMVGFLDAWLLTRNEIYIRAFKNIYKFVFDKMVNPDMGEWFPLLDRRGNLIWDYMGHNWKICYHTLRATCLMVKKLEKIVSIKNKGLQ